MKHSSTTVPAPAAPLTLSETGLEAVLCRDIFLKTVFRQNLSTISSIAQKLCILPPVAQEIVEMARGQSLIETMGASGASLSAEMRYQLTDSGRARALDALEQSAHIGALPVSLAAFKAQAAQQLIRNITITQEMLEGSMSHLVLPSGMLDALGPAVSSGKSILLYGPPGNGKSSISNGIRDAIGDQIFMPNCIEYEGQIVSVYDPIVHGAAQDNPDEQNALRRSIAHDARFTRCKRPTVMTGGELTLDMLDLNYNPVSRTYQAPLQMKATGGVFIVDDLGRQQEPAQALINRWIVPMENNIDILTLQSGQKFVVPFDTLVIFSTNFAPNALFDSAALRRIAYKIPIDGPSRDDFVEIFQRVSRAKGIEPCEAVWTHLLQNKYPSVDNEYANYQPGFLIDQMISICEYEQRDVSMTVELVDRAWENLFVKDKTIAR